MSKPGVRTAVILAGGRGTRLRPYTVVLPKPLVPIGEHPILEVILRQLARAGFGEIILAVNHQAEIIQAFFGDGSKWGLRIRYSLESIPLSTMGPLRLIQDLPENFLIMNGDILSDLDYGAFHDRHAREDRIFSIAASVRKVPIDYGVLELDSNNRLTNYIEKPSLRHHVSMGVYAASRRILESIPAGRKYGVDELMLDLLKQGQAVTVEPYEGYWLDIGRPDDYAQAIDDFEQQRSRFGFD
jgi:NDP-mannose synthase